MIQICLCKYIINMHISCQPAQFKLWGEAGQSETFQAQFNEAVEGSDIRFTGLPMSTSSSLEAEQQRRALQVELAKLLAQWLASWRELPSSCSTVSETLEILTYYIDKLIIDIIHECAR